MCNFQFLSMLQQKAQFGEEFQSDYGFFIWFYNCNSAKLIDIYRTRHNISASTGLSDPAVATGISDLIYESSKPKIPDFIYETTKAKSWEPDALDDDLVNFWAASLGDDGAPAVNRVRT